MAELVNLRQARKQRERTTKASSAETNRALHGESKSAKAARKAEADRAARLLDGAKLERD
ncbi:MAG: DUF4169 family protein [Pseudomonadota bacterium]